MMDKNPTSKLQVRLAMLLVFVLGCVAGALALHTYQKWIRSREDVTRQQRFEQMLDRLQLSNEQRTQVHQILSETREQLQTLRKESEPRFEAIRQQTDERLQKILSADQWRQFEQERDANRSRNRRLRPER